MKKHPCENIIRSCLIFYNRGFFFTEKVYQIIAIMDSKGSNTTASYFKLSRGTF